MAGNSLLYEIQNFKLKTMKHLSRILVALILINFGYLKSAGNFNAWLAITCVPIGFIMIGKVVEDIKAKRINKWEKFLNDDYKDRII